LPGRGGKDRAAPLISVAMIVRDESAHLPACLANLDGLAGEICVVDTGSSDDTVAIARSFGCTLAHFDWCDDFSAARNASLALCTGAWILVIDADERIDADDLQSVRDLAQGPRDLCHRFITRNYTNEKLLHDFAPCAPGDVHAQGFAGWYPSGKVRLFPNGLGARFEGAVHELVNPSLEAAGVAVSTCDVPIHHYPLTKSKAAVAAKRALYLRLGQAKIEEAPEEPRLHAELASQFIELGAYEEAMARYREAVRLEPENPAWLKELGSALYLLGRKPEAAQALRLAVGLDDSLVDAWRNLGVIAVDEGAWEDAAAHFERAIALEDGRSDLYHCLAVALEGAKDLAAAGAVAGEALRRDPLHAAALALYVGVMARQNRREEARALLSELAMAAPGAAGLREAMDQL